MKTLVRSVAAPLLCAATLAAQQPQQQPTEIPKLTETIDIRVINVDVVVTDKKGNPVTGLTKDDFQLYENGVPKNISNFFEVEGPKTLHVSVTPGPGAQVQPQPAPITREEIPENLRRRVIFYIDNLSLAPFNRNRVFKEMKEFARNTLRPGDEAMIATFNRSMKIRLPFTRDTAAIQHTLDAIAGESALGLSNRSEARDVQKRIQDAQTYDDALAQARTYSESVNHDLRQSVESLNGLMTTLAGVEGKKLLVLTTEGFQMQPGREMFYLIDEVSKEKGWSGSSMLEGMSFDAGSQIQSIARTANANGITLYAIHAGGLGAANEGYMAEMDKPTPYTVTQAAISNSTESLQLIADMTGGLASINTNNFAQAFRNIQRDLESYYSLGYRAGTERVDRQRNLQVRVKNRNYVVRNRQTFVEKSTFAEMSDRVIANLLYKTKANDLHILVKVGTPVAAEELFRVPVEIQIPMESLTLLPQGESFMGGFSVYVAVANKEGDMSDVARQTHQIRVPNTDYGTIKGKHYTYALDLLMEPGQNKISVGVVDDVSNTTGFDRVPVIAADLR
ncbi:MAG TPA: VWA domain-containing protein [Thermoanaerobaculia bacterium]|nr:VWA domain-containing protein [Thermoanaerobaculia bacterium]